MNIVALLSSCAMALGLGGIVPQLVRMARSRSAAGQSPLGWGMGAAANLSLAYVNGIAFHAHLLMGSNLTAATLCLAALAQILRYSQAETAAAAPVAVATPLAPVAAAPLSVQDLATQEFEILRDAVLDIDRARRAVAVAA
jgi:hypothetical protein